MAQVQERKAPKRSLWRNQAYMLLWSGQVISSVGTQISDLALPLLVLYLTGSPAQAGLVGAMSALPYVIFCLPAGALVDRWDRKRTMILCDSVRAVSLGSLPLAYALGHLSLVQIYLVAFIEGTFYVFFSLAEVSTWPALVSKEDFPDVAARVELTNSIASLAGQAIGGMLYGLVRVLPFLTDAISYAISVVSLLFIRVPFQEKRESRQRRLWAEISEGVHWLWKQPLLCFLALEGGVVHIVGAGAALLVIVMAQQLHASALVIGLILGAEGIGTLFGALLGGMLQKRWPFAWLLLGTMWLMGLFCLLYLWAPNVVWLALVGVLLAVVMTLFGVIQLSYRLARIPDELQGRVNSVYRLVVFGGDPIGLALTGFLLQIWDVKVTIIIYATSLLLLAVGATLSRKVRGMRS
ncbi:MAG TPA: MFS transporter [Ktedonobacteraceae bacterium]|nr:MFS transporter [Ktedonobacteraceae bacterium]